MMNVLIIEDEVKTANELRGMLTALRPGISVLGILPSIKSAVSWLKANDAPEIIFADIQLADGLSFEIFRSLKISSPIIFCTAFDEFALDAFYTNGIDYLLKPIDEAKLEKSLQKYESLKSAFAQEYKNSENFEKAMESLSVSYKSTLLMQSQGRIIPIKTETIAYIFYDNGSIMFYTFSHKKFFMSSTLDELEAQLDPGMFFRANRQYIVNKAAVENAEHFFPRKLLVKLKVAIDCKIIVSKLRAKEFLKWLETGT